VIFKVKIDENSYSLLALWHFSAAVSWQEGICALLHGLMPFQLLTIQQRTVLANGHKCHCKKCLTRIYVILPWQKLTTLSLMPFCN